MILGVGSDWNNEELSAFGLPFDQRTSRFEESFEIIRHLLAGERVTFRGRFYQVDDAVLCPGPLAALLLDRMAGATEPAGGPVTAPGWVNGSYLSRRTTRIGSPKATKQATKRGQRWQDCWRRSSTLASC